MARVQLEVTTLDALSMLWHNYTEVGGVVLIVLQE